MQINRSKTGGAPVKLNISKAGIADFFLTAAGSLAARALIFDAASPFVLAYISSFLFKGSRFYAAALFAVLGILTSFRSEFSMKYLLAIVILCIVNLFVSIRRSESAQPLHLQAAAAAGSALVAGVTLMFIRGQGLYFAVINLLEAALIFALALVLGRAVGCIRPQTKRGILKTEELIAVVVLAGVLMVGSADVSIWHFSLRYIFATLIVLLAAAGGGAAVGAVCGVLLGFLLNITGFEYIYFAVLLSAAGFAAGAARHIGRLAMLGGFSALALLCALYFDHELLSIATLLSLMAAGVVFFVLPKNFLTNIHTRLNPATAEGGEHIERLCNSAAEQVQNFAAGYSKLAAVFEEKNANATARHFAGVSLAMYDFADELAASLDFRADLENKLVRRFAALGIEVESVAVVLNRFGRYVVTVVRKKRGEDVKSATARAIGTAISHELEQAMELAHAIPKGNSVHLKYCEQSKFSVQSGVAKMKKTHAKESGDSFSLMKLGDSRFVAALSDGMGSGTRARRESETAIELMEELMERAFEKEIALRLINMALLENANDELFTTLDICLLDLNSGAAEFMKIGAARSYILRNGVAEAEPIGHWTLPVGILETVDIDVQKTQLAHGDVIVMMTDGVAESQKGDGGWLADLLAELPTNDPQALADAVLTASAQNYGGEVGDDIMVLVLRLAKRRH